MYIRRLCCGVLFAIAATLTLSPIALMAQSQYPAKPVRLVVPFPAGGATDSAARELGDGLAKLLGQPFVIENRPGADGAIAAQAVLSAPADGYTLLFGSSSMEGIPFVQKSAGFKSLNDFTPISLVCRLAFGLASSPAVKAKGVDDLVTFARANPEKLNYGAGSLSEVMAASQFMRATGTRLTRINYKGGAQIIPDLAANQVQLSFGPLTPMLGFARDGRINVLATLLDRRATVLPELPSLRDAGVVGVSGAGGLQALFGPPALSEQVVDILGPAIKTVMSDPLVRAKFVQRAQEPESSTAAQLTALIRDERASWMEFVAAENIQPE